MKCKGNRLPVIMGIMPLYVPSLWCYRIDTQRLWLSHGGEKNTDKFKTAFNED